MASGPYTASNGSDYAPSIDVQQVGPPMPFVFLTSDQLVIGKIGSNIFEG